MEVASSSSSATVSATTAMMRAATWQALPPRHRGRRSEAKGAEGNTQSRKRKAIKENVEARAAKSAAGTWAEATLEGKDGCAGEFYEYLDHTADVQVRASVRRWQRLSMNMHSNPCLPSNTNCCLHYASPSPPHTPSLLPCSATPGAPPSRPPSKTWHHACSTT